MINSRQLHIHFLFQLLLIKGYYFLIEILSNILCDKVIFKLSQPNRAGLVLPEDIEDDEDLTMLVMPVMLNDNA